MKQFYLILIILIVFSTMIFIVKDKLLSASKTTENRNMTKQFEVKRLADYPIPNGVSAPYIGVHNNQLIVAGGCNFPDKPVTEGGKKLFYKEVYTLDLSREGSEWKKCSPLPFCAAYGGTITTENGVICIGGQNEETVFSEVYLIRFDSVSNNINYTQLPSLPKGIFNMGATILKNKIYVGGGASNKSELYILDLDKPETGWNKLNVPLRYERQQSLLIGQYNELLLCGGYDENEAKVHTDILQFNFKKNCWEEYIDTIPEIKTLVGASVVNWGTEEILVLGGVNYQRFVSALTRIQETQKAMKENNAQLIDSLKQKGKEYMLHSPEWYRFNSELLKFNLKTNNWRSLGKDECMTRAGAGIALWKNKLFVVCGELKPGVRTAEVNCLTLNDKLLTDQQDETLFINH